MESTTTDTVRLGGMELRFLVDETQGSGDLVMFEFAVEPNGRVPVPHYHREVDEAVYGLSGTLTVTRDGQKHDVRAGDCVLIPRGSVHHHENLHDETARALVVLNPGSIGRRFFEEVAQATGGPAKPDPARLQQIMQTYGLVPA